MFDFTDVIVLFVTYSSASHKDAEEGASKEGNAIHAGDNADDFSAIARHVIMHVLFTGPKTFSEVRKLTLRSITKQPSFDAMVRAVSVQMGGGMCAVRPELHEHFDPFYFRYTPNQRLKALGYVAKLRNAKAVERSHVMRLMSPARCE